MGCRVEARCETHAYPWLVAQTRRSSPGSGLNVDPAMPYARPERPAWSEPSPQARSSTSSLLAGQPLPEHDVRRIARAEVDARELLPAVLRVEAARLARTELRREQRTVVRLPRQKLREQRTADAPALPRRPHVQLDDLIVRDIQPLLALARAERAGDALRPPLPVGAGVAVGEPDGLVPGT